jgi:hypothetical protein
MDTMSLVQYSGRSVAVFSTDALALGWALANEPAPFSYTILNAPVAKEDVLDALTRAAKGNPNCVWVTNQPREIHLTKPVKRLCVKVPWHK